MFIMRVFFISCVAVCMQTHTAHAERPSEVTTDSLRSREGIILLCDFESDTWFEQFGISGNPERVDLVSSDPARKFAPLAGKALRIRVDRGGHYGASILYRFKRRTGAEPEEIYFRYYLRFGDDWDPAGGGKLPGISGTYGRGGWGGRPSNGRNGWSARGQFNKQKDGKTPVGFYCYHADMKGQYGSGWIWKTEERGYLENNRWYCIEQYAKMNTPGKNDGILRAWVDGKQAFEKTDIRMRDVDTLKIEAVWLNVYLGGKWTSKSEHHLYIDNVVIARKYIGPRKTDSAKYTSSAKNQAAVSVGWHTPIPHSRFRGKPRNNTSHTKSPLGEDPPKAKHRLSFRPERSGVGESIKTAIAAGDPMQYTIENTQSTIPSADQACFRALANIFSKISRCSISACTRSSTLLLFSIRIQPL